MSELGEKIIEGVRAAAAERPDYVYEKFGGCRYIRDDAPSCLVGHGLWAAGLIDKGWGGDFLGDSSFENVAKEYGWPLDLNEVHWLSDAQDRQDEGCSWEAAVYYADGLCLDDTDYVA